MKKIIIILVLFLFFSVSLSNNRAYAALPTNIIFTITWQGSWFFCFFSGSVTCSISLDIKFDSGLNTSTAESILGYSLPANAIPVILQNSSFNNTQDGFNGITMSQSFMIVDSKTNQNYQVHFPEQNMVYSNQYGGFIGWCFEN